MRKFIGRGILFALGLGLIFVLALWINRLLSIPPYRCGAKIATIVTGDSQVQYAVDDRLLDGAGNIAQQSESYLHSYYKLRHVLRHNPSIRRVVLGFNYHSVSSYYDDEFITGKYAETVMARYYGIMGPADIARTIGRKPAWALSAVKALMTGRGHPFIGTFPDDPGSGFSEASLKKRIAKQYYLDGRVRGLARVNPEYLSAIVRLCQDRGLDLVLLTPPLHPAYRRQVPPPFVEAYQKKIGELRLPVLDLQGLELPDAQYLPDGDHLAAPGAAIATREFEQLLNTLPDPERPF